MTIYWLYSVCMDGYFMNEFQINVIVPSRVYSLQRLRIKKLPKSPKFYKFSLVSFSLNRQHFSHYWSLPTTFLSSYTILQKLIPIDLQFHQPKELSPAPSEVSLCTYSFRLSINMFKKEVQQKSLQGPHCLHVSINSRLTHPTFCFLY